MIIIKWLKRLFRKKEYILGYDISDGDDYSAYAYGYKDKDGVAYITKIKYEVK